MPPYYIKIRKEIAQQIAAGVWKAGDRLPSDSIFSRRYHVSKGTIRLVMNQLAEKNIVRREQGKGTFVLGTEATQNGIKLNEIASSFHQKLEYDIHFISIDKGNGDNNVLDLLGIHHNKKYIELIRSGTMSDKTICYFKTYIPYDRYKKFMDISVDEFSKTTPWKILAEKFGLKVDHIEETISIKPPSEEDKIILGVSSNILLLVTENLYFGSDGLPVKYQIGKWNLGDNVLFRSIVQHR